MRGSCDITEEPPAQPRRGSEPAPLVTATVKVSHPFHVSRRSFATSDDALVFLRGIACAALAFIALFLLNLLVVKREPFAAILQKYSFGVSFLFIFWSLAFQVLSHRMRNLQEPVGEIDLSRGRKRVREHFIVQQPGYRGDLQDVGLAQREQ